jgi:GTPase
MPGKRKEPLVVICGRPNVGKSTLFNRIIGRQRAIVHSQEGITRDRFITTASWDNHRFRMVDTGGIIENPIDPISKKMQEQVRLALDEAAVIVLVVDGQQELTRIDLELRDALYRYGKPVVLAVNKLDNPKLEANRFDFYELGLGDPFCVSSTHNLGVDDLMQAVTAHLPENAAVAETAEDMPEKVLKVAVTGKPNAGKSSFINAILNEERTIVDATPGTTRDAIDIEFAWQGRDYLLIDTAGMRRKAGIKEKVESFSVTRSLRAIRRADICLIMIDAIEGISEQDKRIIGYAQETGTAMIMIWTKWDLVEDKERKFKAIPDELDLKVPYLEYVPYLTISNVTRQRIFKVFDLIDRVGSEAEKRIGTGELNQFFEGVRVRHKPSGQKGRLAKVYYLTQTGVKPTTFVLFVNQKKLFHFSYVRFIENQIRERYGFEGVPITIELREGKPRK